MAGLSTIRHAHADSENRTARKFVVISISPFSCSVSERDAQHDDQQPASGRLSRG